MPVTVKETYSKTFLKIEKRLNNNQNLMNQIGVRLKKHIVKAFDTAGQSYEEPGLSGFFPWKEHSDVTKDVRSYRKTYNVPQPILIESGKMSRKVVSKRFKRSDVIGFETKDWKALIHQDGKGTPGKKGYIPPRPIYHITSKFADNVELITINWILTGKYSG